MQRVGVFCRIRSTTTEFLPISRVLLAAACCQGRSEPLQLQGQVTTMTVPVYYSAWPGLHCLPPFTYVLILAPGTTRQHPAFPELVSDCDPPTGIGGAVGVQWSAQLGQPGTPASWAAKGQYHPMLHTIPWFAAGTGGYSRCTYQTRRGV